MAKKVSLPSVVGMPMEGIPNNVIGFFQAVEEGIKTIDNNTVYKDGITLAAPNPRITAKSAQGQAFSISGTNVASGDDYVQLVSDFQALLQSHLDLNRAFNTLLTQIRGT